VSAHGIDPIAGQLEPPRLKVNHALRDPYLEFETLFGDEKVEARLIGSALLDVDCRQLVLEVPGDHFRHPGFRVILDAIRRLDARGEMGFDYGAVRAELRAMGEVDLATLTELVIDCGEVADTVAATRHYIEILLSYRKRMSFLDRLHVAAKTAHTDTVLHIDEMIAQHAMAIADLMRHTAGAAKTGKELADEVLAEYERTKAEGASSFLYTGIRGVDEVIGGMGRGTLNVLAARPSTGKSALATSIIGPLIAAGRGVVDVTFEVSRVYRVANVVAAKVGVNAGQIKHASLSEVDQSRYFRAVRAVESLPYIVESGGGLNASQIRARVLRAQRKWPVELVVIDHLGYMRDNDGTSRQSEVERIGGRTKALKELAVELNTRVLLICQMNRAIEGRTEQRPNLSDLRGSGNIEEDADVVAFLHRPYRINGKDLQGKEGDPGETHFYVQKNRDGMTAFRKLRFDPTCLRMSDEFR
jgi:replicative DNA helicase